jgi:hypothetical protein
MAERDHLTKMISAALLPIMDELLERLEARLSERDVVAVSTALSR